MKRTSSIGIMMVGFFCILLTSLATAHEKVVVIPLNSSSSKISNNSSPCNSSTAGIIRWTGTDFEGCDGSYWGRFSLTANVPTVTSGTGRIWMDRNLGASRVATSPTDYLAYGDLYQWGRLTDGHENPNSSTTSNTSTTDVPGHGYFITNDSSPVDWRVPQNDNLWQGVSGTNNPCPSGFRLPTVMELEDERTSWSSNNAAGAFASPLKLVMAGARHPITGALSNAGINGFYSSSTVGGSGGAEACRILYFESGNADTDITSGFRASGYSVRCIKD